MENSRNNVFVDMWKKNRPLNHIEVKKYIEDGFGFVYFISDGTYVKIGMTNDIVMRFSQIQSSNPRKLTLLKFIPTEHPKGDERHFHKSFDKYKVRGEWFILSSEILSYIVSNDLTPNMHFGYIDELISSQPVEERESLIQMVKHWIEELNIEPWNIWDMLQRQIHYKNNL